MPVETPKGHLLLRHGEAKDFVPEEIEEPLCAERFGEPADFPILLGINHCGFAVWTLERLVAAQIDRAERKVSATFDPVLEYAEFAK